MAAKGELATEPQGPSARQRLIEWASGQDGWVRSVVAEVLTTRRPVSDEVLAAIRDRYLVEKRLTDGELPEAPLLDVAGANGDLTEPLVLRELRECRGVNALASGQTIAFNPHLTVLFGENAAGKTGYVRVLKLLADVRSAEQIIPDIHRPSTPDRPEAAIAYSIGTEDDELHWHGERGVPPFTRMTVFDSPAVALHLDDNVTYVYTPADLALFGYVHGAIQRVRDLLQKQMDERRPRQNPFLTTFVRGTDLYPRIEALSGSTNLEELQGLADVTAEERTELDSLRGSIEALSNTSTGESQIFRNRATILRNLITVANTLTAFDPAAFSEAVDVELSAQSAQTESAAAVFGGGQLPDKVRPAWQRFIEAGENYLLASGQETYPREDDSCIYCQQALDDAARELLHSYRSYASGVAAAALRTASGNVTQLQAGILTSTVTTALEGLRATLPDLRDVKSAPEWLADGEALLASADEVRSAVERRVKIEARPRTVPANLVARLSVALEETETAVRELDGDAAQRQETLASQRSRATELEARLRLSQLLPDIRTFVKDAAWADSLRTLLGRFQGLLKGLTETGKQASDHVLNHDFEQKFYDECQLLRAPPVTLDFPGRRGQATRRKSVTREHSLADILSEGEQKVIAIADFLAEASLPSGSAPIIFDDPVSSFDYRRVREIAKRIAVLSNEHQVIVFTHDIWFTSELLAEFAQRSSDCRYYQIVDNNGVKGVVSRAAHPRLDSVASVKRRVNAAIQDATGGTDADRQHRIDSAYNDIRTWCEIIVESTLLNRVTQRHQPNVAMQNLNAINVDGLQQAIDVIYPIWEKANRYTTAHSQPTGTLGIRPTMGELRQDWEVLQQALKDYEGH